MLITASVRLVKLTDRLLSVQPLNTSSPILVIGAVMVISPVRAVQPLNTLDGISVTLSRSLPMEVRLTQP